MIFGEMIDADTVTNPQHFGSDPVDIRIRIRINPRDLDSSPESLLVEVRRLGGGLRCLCTVYLLYYTVLLPRLCRSSQ